MKKVLIMAAMVSALSLSSQAAIVQVFCGSANSTNGSTNGAANGNGGFGNGGSIVCPSFNIGAGSTLNQVIIDAVMTYDGNFTGFTTNASVALTSALFNNGSASMAINSGLSGNGAPFNVITLPDRGNSTANPLMSSNSVGVSGGFVDAFSVTTAFSLAVAQGLPTNTFRGGTSVGVYASYVFDPFVPPSNGIPEPSTVALIGAGLVGLATAARRRRS